MSLVLQVLASGSKGNASIVGESDSGRAVLIDCGICKRDFFERAAAVGVSLQSIEAIVITHEHTDHTKGLGVVLRGLAKQDIHPTVYASKNVVQASRELSELQGSFGLQYFKSEAVLSLAGLSLYPFSTSHDTVESYGFRVEGKHKDTLGYLTDSGIVSATAREYLANCRILALESNYDQYMLEHGPYPYPVKKRIMSDRGHLSNEQSADVLESLLCNELEQVVAMHISENNNTYKLPQEMLSRITERNTHSAQVVSSYQYIPTSIS